MSEAFAQLSHMQFFVFYSVSAVFKVRKKRLKTSAGLHIIHKTDTVWSKRIRNQKGINTK